MIKSYGIIDDMKDTVVIKVLLHVLGKASTDEIDFIEVYGFADASNLA